LKLEISDIHKAYNGKAVLSGSSFIFDRKKTYVLMGHNGSGKSTLFRLCALLEPPDSGEINYFEGDRLLTKDIALKRKITLVLPGVGLFNNSVYNNVAYGLKIRKMPEKEIADNVEYSLNFVGLFEKRKQNALTLSSGEAQRLGIARAIVIKPDVLFLDEPTAHVDEKNTEIIEDLILKIKNSGKSMVFITTHDASQAERLADVMLLLDKGKIALFKKT
jgi:tungstate transport system ATP-binding protein